MQPLNKAAIILGATGLTGGILLEELLRDDRYEEVKSFSRSTTGISHPKLKEYLGDLTSLSHFKSKFTADEVYCCIGTTKSKTPDKEKYREIDYGIPVEAARLCKENDIDTFIVISALGADPGSSIFYNRLKGEMEEAVLNQNLRYTYIMQPSLISGKRTEKRAGEGIAIKLFSVLNFFLLGPLKKYRSIPPDDIARAMIWLANNDYSQTRVESDTITSLAHA